MHVFIYTHKVTTNFDKATPKLFYFRFLDTLVAVKCKAMISESGKVAITTILSIFAIVDVIGNSLVCVVITRNQDMRYVLNKVGT